MIYLFSFFQDRCFQTNRQTVPYYFPNTI